MMCFKVSELASEGGPLVFLDRFPEDIPGYNALDLRRRILING